jgi:hypothetical protein
MIAIPHTVCGALSLGWLLLLLLLILRRIILVVSIVLEVDLLRCILWISVLLGIINFTPSPLAPSHGLGRVGILSGIISRTIKKINLTMLRTIATVIIHGVNEIISTKEAFTAVLRHEGGGMDLAYGAWAMLLLAHSPQET